MDNDFYIKEDGTIVRNNYNSGSKPPKKSNRGVWTIVIILIIAAIVGGIVLYQETLYSSSNNSSYKTYQTATVQAYQGLIIRENPNRNSLKLTTAPLNFSLEIIEDNYKQDYIEGNSGYWVKVRYNGIVGYVWGNYLIIK